MKWGGWLLFSLVGAAALQEPMVLPVAIGLVAFILAVLWAVERFAKGKRKP